MEEKLTESEMQFLGFISMMANTALYQLGKVGHPVTGKTEKDLNAAQMTIELLQMIQDKTKGNLTKSEESVLQDYLTHLRMNYVEEVEEEKKKPQVEKGKKEEKPSAPEKPADESGEKMNWEKHERKSYGPGDSKK